jgi:hypothetical protein
MNIIEKLLDIKLNNHKIKTKTMNSNTKTTILKDRKTVLSLLWIFAMFNYLYADVLTIMDPVNLTKIVSGTGPFQMSQGFLLGAAVLMETAIAMVLLSRVLNYRANRWANIIAGFINTAAVFSSMFAGKPALYYLFFGIIEIACTSFIIWYAGTWKGHEDHSNQIPDSNPN